MILQLGCSLYQLSWIMSTRLPYVSPAQMQCVSSSALCQLSCHLSTQLLAQLQLVSSAVGSTLLAQMYFAISVASC